MFGNYRQKLRYRFEIYVKQASNILHIYNKQSYGNIHKSSRLQAYCIFKHNFELEKYLDVVSEKKYKIALARFRTSSHNLAIETGQYDDTPRADRICKSCNMKQIENEYNFLFVCPLYHDIRVKYSPFPILLTLALHKQA